MPGQQLRRSTQAYKSIRHFKQEAFKPPAPGRFGLDRQTNGTKAWVNKGPRDMPMNLKIMDLASSIRNEDASVHY